MKNLASLFLGLGIAAGATGTAVAQNATVSAMEMINSEYAAAPTARAVTAPQSFALMESPAWTPTLNQGNFLDKAPEVAPRKLKSMPKPLASASDVSGYYVGLYNTLTSSSYDGGTTMQIVPDATGDSVTIKYFWNRQSVRACVDKITSTITIPRQTIMVDATYGAIDLAVTLPTGAPDYDSQIIGTIGSDGSIDFSDSWWGVYVQEGANKDRFLGAYYNLSLSRATGQMTYKSSTGADIGYYVLIEQTSKNTLKVSNVFNYGLEIEVELKRDRTAEINSQVALINASGSWILIRCVEFNDAGNLTKYSPIVNSDAAAATNNTMLSWTDWSLLCLAANSYAGHLTDAKLQAYTPFSYPELSVTEFTGEGTEKSPYLLRTLDDLILLADKVNNDTEYVGKYYNLEYTRTYLGKYFALDADIDMGGYKFEPIGGTTNQRFAGQLDGRGHTIKGLNVNGGSQFAAGLFGYTDTLSVLKNIVLESPVMNADYYSAGALVAWCNGSVENVTVNAPNVTSARTVAGGVAGIVLQSVKDCHVTDGYVEGGGYVGGVVGEVHGGISDCSANASIYLTGSSAPAGGVAGNILSGDSKNLEFTGYVSYKAIDAVQYLGGVAGMVQVCTLSNSFSNGVIRGYNSQSCVGGVAGVLTGEIRDCYSAGVVHCYSRLTGGIVGQIKANSLGVVPAVRTSYTSALVEAETYQYNRQNCAEVVGAIAEGLNPELENIYYDSQVTNFYSTRFGALTSELTSASGPKGFSSSEWTFTAGAYPRVKALAESEGSKYSASAVDMKPSDSYKKFSSNTPITALGSTQFYFLKNGALYKQGHYAAIVNNQIEIGEEFGMDTLYICNGNVQTYRYMSVAPIPFEGDGTEESPLLIKTKEDLITLSEATTNKRQTFPGIYFKLANDIDMEHDTRFLGIDADNSASAASIAFQGVFDGDGHTIENLTVAGRLAWTTPRQDGKTGTLNTTGCRGISGLFGRVGVDGVVKNLTIGAGSQLEMYAQCAAIVGTLDGRVENCRNYADVLGYSCWVGGIVGQMNKGSVVSGCYNAGNITTGYANAGGIAGSCAGTIENCVNTGDIRAILLVTNYSTQLQRVGGISGGSGGAIYRNCANYGTVWAEKNNAGGITAALEGTSAAGSGNDDVVSCLNVGNVYCGNQATLGAIAGLKGTKSISNVYFDAQTIGLKAAANSDVEGMNGESTATLTAGKVLEGLDAAEWDYTAGMYPALKLFADEVKVKAARKVILDIPEGNSVSNLLVNASLSSSAKWSLKDGSVFKISGSTLQAPSVVDDVVTDTLVAVNEAGVRRPILLQAKPVNPLAGEGTEASPFIISTADDWNALSAYMDKAADDLAGMFVKIAGDIDFNDVAIKRLGSNGVATFKGTLDGAGHTLKNLAITSVANQSCALVGTLDAEGVIKNLALEGVVNGTYTYAAPLVDKLYGKLSNIESRMEVNSTKQYAAGVVGYAYGNAMLENVKFAGKITSSGTYVGGLVGVSIASGRVTYKDCAFEGTIEQTTAATKATAIYVGGFVANCGPATFEDCVSDGQINLANTTFTTNVAGFAGNIQGNKNDSGFYFTNCQNATSITAGGKVAGFVACALTSTTAATAKFIMTDCVNTGDITSESTTAMSSSPTAGLLMQYTPSSKITRCHNEGTIISNKNVYAAGIVGYYAGTPVDTTAVEITDCWNEGLIVADGNQGGGICGYVMGRTILTRCYNTADIEGNQMLGGITSGFAGTGPEMINCYNTGNVTAKAQRAAGLIAWGAPTGAVVRGCWNSGRIASTSEEQSAKVTAAYSVGGLAGQGGASFIDCYNVGEVVGLSQVGGLVGTPVKAKTSFANCYNAGKISAPADSCGSIVGVNTDNGKLWADGNSMSNTYYLDINNCDNDAIITAKKISRVELAALDLGEGFTSPDDYTHPLVKEFAEHPVALFHAAELVLSENDTADKVPREIYLGGTPSVIWSADCDAIAIAGNTAYFTKPYSGAVTMTASCGDNVKQYVLQAAATSGIGNLDADGLEVVEVRYFNTAGVEIPAPSAPSGQVYIKVSKMSDGSTRIEKVIGGK